MKTTGNEGLGEKPLSGTARIMLVLGVGAVMLSFYVFSIFAILLLSALIVAELVVLLALARFAAAQLMVPFLGKHVGLLTLFVKNFRCGRVSSSKFPSDRKMRRHCMSCSLNFAVDWNWHFRRRSFYKWAMALGCASKECGVVPER